MTLFNRAPGVEWTEDGPSTVPLVTPQARADAFPPACGACGGELGIDGYCLQCGQKARNLREHYELAPVPWLAGVCDIGLAHPHNEDALAAHAEADRAVIVVCDGVTTSDDSDVASIAGAHAAADRLWASNPQGTGTPGSRAAAMAAVLAEAVAAANQAVIGATDPHSLNSAAATLAIAVIDAGMLYCANLGDSRVYWLPVDGEPVLATKDHSLAQAGIESGTGRAEAESSVFAHTITKWLGRDAIDLEPYTATVDIGAGGWVLVCSDGLWNYASEPSALGALVTRFTTDDATPPHLVAALAAWANEQGGHDNITVACAWVAPPGPPADEPTVTAPISSD
ncbi:MAG: protein phosphatase 2C domain-containing protein [Propionibacteriaceae bacterium]|jgi:serine/threonine protein phosphatase PrpC|nr:protein phosphatase 2C domain-containing protein [Propionibacteriaceae bacterium]